MKNLKNKITYIILGIILIIYIISIVPKNFQNDTFFTIAIGNQILENGIQKNDTLVWHENLEFTNSRWLFDVIIASIFNNYDFLGIYIFVIFVAVLQCLIFYYILNKISQKKFLSLIYTIIVFYFIQGGFTGRAQIISYTLFLIEFYCIENISKEYKLKYFVLLCILPVLIANFHASVFPVYFIMFLPYFAEYILSRLNLKSDESSKVLIEKNNIKYIIILFIIGILAGFCTPREVKPYTDMFKATTTLSTSIIQELQPLNLFENYLFTILNLIVIGIIGFSKTKIRVKDAFYIIGFDIMALFAVRNIYFFYLIASICIFRVINDFLKKYIIIESYFKKNKIIKFFFIIIIFLFILMCINNIIDKLNDDYVETKVYPVDATEYILNNLEVNDMRIYNSFNFGSYLEFKGIPVFIDSRSGIYTEEFNPRNNNSTRLV